MIEQDSIAGKQAMSLSIVHRHPMSIELRRSIRTAGIERSCFVLRWRRRPEHLATRSVVKLCLNACFADRFQYADGPESGDVACVLGYIETHPHVTLRAEMIDFIGLDRSNNPVQGTAVVEISMDQDQALIGFMRILVNMVYAAGVQRARAANNSIDLVVLRQQKLGQIGSILSSDTRDERFFHG